MRTFTRLSMLRGTCDRLGCMNLDWMAGFFDGEGSVSLQIYRSTSHRCGYGFAPRVSIAQKKRGVLDEIENILQIGHVYRGSRSTWRMEVRDRAELIKFCSLFLNRVRLKRTQLALLRKAILLLQDRKAKILSKELSIRLVETAQQIRHLNDHARNRHTDPVKVRRSLV